jgi:LacI family xylobiose transport system transcriptional regulator
VKLAVIAREVGVSISTVSKVVNGRADVATGTRARVQEALRRHGYRRAASPAAGAKLNSALLDVVIRELDSAWASTLVSGIERAASERGLNIVVSTVQLDQGRPVPPRRWLDQVAARGTCGVLGILTEFSAAQVAYLRDGRIPCVVIDPAAEPDPAVATVRIDNRASQYLLTRHLIGLGHRKIAFVVGNPSSLPASEREAGFEEAMRDAGLELREDWRKFGGFGRESSQEAMAELMALADRPTAVMFASDKGALGALAEANRLGLKVPDDVSVTGFDDIPDAAGAVPALTTVRQPVPEMVEAAMRHLTEAGTPGETIECTAEVVIRATTARPPSR